MSVASLPELSKQAEIHILLPRYLFRPPVFLFFGGGESSEAQMAEGKKRSNLMLKLKLQK